MTTIHPSASLPYEYTTNDTVTPEQLESRRRSAILEAARGICIRIMKTMIAEQRPLDADDILAHIDAEETLAIADAEKYPTCNNLQAFNHRDEISGMIRDILRTYYPCPDERIADRDATEEALCTLLWQDEEEDSIESDKLVA